MSGILVTILNTLVIAGAVVSAITAVHSERLIGSILALAATGSFIGLEFIMLQAPDVAIAEVSVGAILSTILYVIALRKVREVDIRNEVSTEAVPAASDGLTDSGNSEGSGSSEADGGNGIDVFKADPDEGEKNIVRAASASDNNADAAGEEVQS